MVMIVDVDSVICPCKVSMWEMAFVCSSFTTSVLSENVLQISPTMLDRLSSVVFSVTNSSDRRLTSLSFLTASSMLNLMVFHSAFGFVFFVIVGMSELLEVSESDEVNVKVAFVIAELRIVRVP